MTLQSSETSSTGHFLVIEVFIASGVENDGNAVGRMYIKPINGTY